MASVVCVEGDPNHPFNQGRLCAKGLAIPQYMYHPNRVTHPLKRVGERGEGKWKQITWDEAYDTIEKKFKDIRSNFGAESVIFCQGTGRDIGGAITFLMYAYGSPNWVQVGLAGHACYTRAWVPCLLLMAIIAWLTAPSSWKNVMTLRNGLLPSTLLSGRKTPSPAAMTDSMDTGLSTV
jgi:hypothetical protein